MFINKWRKIVHIVLVPSVIIIISFLLFLAASGIFIYRNILVNLEETLFALFHTVGALNGLYLSIATVLLRRKLITIFNGLTTIYNESEKKELDILSMEKLFFLI